ncbi:hypothetical protein [Adhaeribacter rhizoryzae]|uniref:Uncharacterized protein n=1 Tax=Adhaeribacter rhizoryzae TaxID=2607907 RepID=A0A5M6DS28_9BACT|nr:hypothetical protein [Adhaeribacter rhizoryzae]KAA5549126.1 hypothetical protein F0145_00570 [Adhaeribacter rhizoryzae]
MDLQARKILFVQEFLRLNNENIISKFEHILHTEKKKLYAEKPSPMSLADFNQVINNSEEDAASGRVKETDELDKDIDAWS